MLQPIHYSLILNVLILAVTGVLSWLMNNALIVVLGFMVMQHMAARFEDPSLQERHPAQSFGFVPSDPDDEED